MEITHDVLCSVIGASRNVRREREALAESKRQLAAQRERELADEAARQRKLTSQSLADIDLLGRSVKTVQLQETFAMAGANTAARARREPTPGWGDLLGGIMRAVAGEK